MPDVQEVFRMATQKVRPDEGFVERQLDHQRRRARNRRNGTIAVVTAIVAVAAVLVFRALPGGETTPATPPEELTTPPAALVEFPRVATVQPDPDVPLVRFESARYGYSIGYPEIWSVSEAKESLAVNGIPSEWDPTTDYFSLTAPALSEPALFVAAQPVDPGTTLREWTSRTEVIDPCVPPDTHETVRVGGEKATLAFFPGCAIPQKFYLEATVVHNDMGYHIVWYGNTGDEARDRAVLDRILASFAFTD